MGKYKLGSKLIIFKIKNGILDIYKAIIGLQLQLCLLEQQEKLIMSVHILILFYSLLLEVTFIRIKILKYILFQIININIKSFCLHFRKY